DLYARLAGDHMKRFIPGNLPNVLLMQELVDNSKTKKIIEFISAGSTIGRALSTPPGVPADRLAALHEGFDKVVKDPEVIADAAKGAAEPEPTPGGTGQACSAGVARGPRDVTAAAPRAIAAEKADKKQARPCSGRSGTATSKTGGTEETGSVILL